jgi:hypothetical protein
VNAAQLVDIPLECLDLEAMASGETSLKLTERVEWDAFPRYAEALVSVLEGTITNRADSAGERIWTTTIRGGVFWISFDDFPFGVSLEPQDRSAGLLIPGIRDTLLAFRRHQEAG